MSSARWTRETPRKLVLKSGQVVRVEKVCYPYGRNFWRIGYRNKDGELRGCLALHEETHFLEQDDDAMLQVAITRARSPDAAPGC